MQAGTCTYTVTHTHTLLTPEVGEQRDTAEGPQVQSHTDTLQEMKTACLFDFSSSV